MNISKVVLSICIGFAVLSWINSHYEPSKFEESYSQNKINDIKLVKS